MRSRTRRSFSVEVKSAGRRQAAVIPSRVEPPATPVPRLLKGQLADPVSPPVEPRRILPNLIVPELPPEPEPAVVVEDRPQRRRSRPPKAAPGVTKSPLAEAVAVQPVIAAAPAVPARPSEPVSAMAPTKRPKKPGAPLAPGERWKHRLGRWAR